MTDDGNFAGLVRRVRSGDVQATQELIRRYEPAIRREARLRLGPSLRPTFDSMDLCQSVLGSFLARAVAGQYRLDSPGGVMRLLVEMTRNKVREKARRRREASLGGHDPVDPDQDPTVAVLGRDFLEEFRKRLTGEELALWERRRRDVPWQVIATELGSTPESLRQRYSRAIHRVAAALGLEEMA